MKNMNHASHGFVFPHIKLGAWYIYIYGETLIYSMHDEILNRCVNKCVRIVYIWILGLLGAKNWWTGGCFGYDGCQHGMGVFTTNYWGTWGYDYGFWKATIKRSYHHHSATLFLLCFEYTEIWPTDQQTHDDLTNLNRAVARSMVSWCLPSTCGCSPATVFWPTSL